jgi:hypothetical protein
MNVLSFEHEGMDNSSYLVALSDGEAALIDRDRNSRGYVKAAEARGWRRPRRGNAGLQPERRRNPRSRVVRC